MKAVHPLTVLILALAACSPSEQGGGSASLTDSGWNAADACSLVSKADVAAAAGAEVSSAVLEGVSTGGGGLAVVSTCRYTLANGSTITLLARKAPSGDTTDAAIEAARTMGGAMPAAGDVPGLGRKAFWTPEMHTLQVFIDDHRYLALGAFEVAEDAQPVLTAIARKAF